MSYWHALYQPYHKGERVQVVETVYTGKQGQVTAIEPENAFDGENATYRVRFDGEEADCPQAFAYWQLEPEP